MDVHSPEQRRFNIFRIWGKDTRPEIHDLEDDEPY